MVRHDSLYISIAPIKTNSGHLRFHAEYEKIEEVDINDNLFAETLLPENEKNFITATYLNDWRIGRHVWRTQRPHHSSAYQRKLSPDFWFSNLTWYSIEPNASKWLYIKTNRIFDLFLSVCSYTSSSSFKKEKGEDIARKSMPLHILAACRNEITPLQNDRKRQDGKTKCHGLK